MLGVAVRSQDHSGRNISDRHYTTGKAEHSGSDLGTHTDRAEVEGTQDATIMSIGHPANSAEFLIFRGYGPKGTIVDAASFEEGRAKHRDNQRPDDVAETPAQSSHVNLAPALLSNKLMVSTGSGDGGGGSEGENITVTAPRTNQQPPPEAAPGTVPRGQNGDGSDGTGGYSSTSTVASVADSSPAIQLIRTTPTGDSEYNKLISEGWKFTWTDQLQSFTNRTDHSINISNRWINDPHAAASQIAHEMGHALYDPPVDESSRDNFIRTELYGEGAATANNIKISLEAGDRNIPISGSSELIGTYIDEYNDGIRAGDMTVAYREIGNTYGTSEVTGAGVSYSETYGHWYDVEKATGQITK
ncbi:hypothetical protein HLH36_18645 [Gluconacetobacter aggeris]|uniref:Uncharacterized protein n=1 Tax=Gluconacetobacter aggeris TaxID=1286186 RepID=A0A7W4NXX1_9PROT|nr:hypothetical protein [Gluconacetobacter aggeris]MBB2170336.1 hypothetical protein [Gluconacetobacter aggeris]